MKTFDTINSAVETLADIIDRGIIGDLSPGRSVCGYPSLRKLISDCGVSAIERDGKQIGLNRARKDELIAEAHRITQNLRVLQRVAPEFEALTPEQVESVKFNVAAMSDMGATSRVTAFTREYIRVFHNYVQSLFNTETHEWSTPTNEGVEILATKVVKFLDTLTGVDRHTNVRIDYSPKYIQRQRWNISKTLERYIRDVLDTRALHEWGIQNQAAPDPDFQRYAWLVYERLFGDGKRGKPFGKVFTLMRDVGERAKQQDATRMEERKAEGRITVKLDTVLTRAHELLSSLSDTTPRKTWRDVVFALALVTGRRQGEILATGVFEPVSENPMAVRFTGQTKLHGVGLAYYRRNPSYVIPTLVKSEYVIRAIDWLDKHHVRVRCDNTGRLATRDNYDVCHPIPNWPDEPGHHLLDAVVNKRYNAQLTGSRDGRAYYWGELLTGTPGTRVAPHDFRRLYSQAISHHLTHFSDKLNAIADALGDGRGGSKLVVERYDLDFTLAPDSVTEIYD